MNKNQAIVLILAFGLLLGLYFLPISPAEKTGGASAMEATDKIALLHKANEKYTPEQLVEIRQLSDLVENEGVDSVRLEWLEKLSGAWYKVGEPALAGVYAQEIAELRNDEKSWAIAGTTYALGVRKHKENSTQLFCQKRAVEALENAISINPENVSYRINLALCYVDMPPKDNPMKGILMLRELASKYPNNVGVLTQLGGLAIQTGQYTKAIERLEQARKLSPKNPQVLSLLVGAYKGSGNTVQAEKLEMEMKSLQN